MDGVVMMIAPSGQQKSNPRASRRGEWIGRQEGTLTSRVGGITSLGAGSCAVRTASDLRIGQGAGAEA